MLSFKFYYLFVKNVPITEIKVKKLFVQLILKISRLDN